ncbi:unnamed protein product [Somion occarium]|uniref:N-acetyltransferase domain-containing protein n=1 Tax=Somion occarium TaxID=3059160 RepID=A0ABP1D047_9APHY
MSATALEVPPHEIVVIKPYIRSPDNWKELREQCYSVRIDVFHHEQGFPIEDEIDNLEDVATHFLLRLTSGSDAGKPVGTIRYTKQTSPSTRETYYKLSRFAVLKDYRNYRFGVGLVNALHDYIRTDARKSRNEGSANGNNAPGDQDGFVRVVCHSQIYIKGFYEKVKNSTKTARHTRRWSSVFPYPTSPTTIPVSIIPARGTTSRTNVRGVKI